MIFRITFEYEVDDETEAKTIRDEISPLVHDPYKVTETPDNRYYEIDEGR